MHLSPVEDYTMLYLLAAKENIHAAMLLRLPMHIQRELLAKLIEIKKEIFRRKCASIQD